MPGTSEEAGHLPGDRYSLLLQAAPDLALMWLDSEGRILECSPGAEALFHSTPGTLISLPFARLYAPGAAPRQQARHELMLAATTGRVTDERVWQRADGSTFRARAALAAIREEGRHTGYLLRLEEVSAARSAEEALRTAEERLARVLEVAPVGLVFLDGEGRVAFSNPAARELLGAPVPRLHSDPEWALADTVMGTRVDDPFRFLRVIRTGEAAREIDYRLDSPTATQFIATGSTPLRDGNGTLSGVLVTLRDATPGRRAADERAARTRAEELARGLVQAQEEERRRISRELHDDVGQSLTALRLLLPGGEEADGDRREAARALVEELMGKVRALSLDLRPAMLDDLGLVPALLWLADRFTGQTGIEVRVEHSGLDLRSEAVVEIAAFRLVQEALTNVARHAATLRATVRVWADEAYLGVQVEDHGRGFDPAERRAGASSGLAGMADRVRLLGGRFDLDSRTGEGTRVTAELPRCGLPSEEVG